ncbi:hypothetical protein K413DRAFT_4601 [Clostridium sp. ASBs410]|nr:hypothetical protein K413DRAFT_4601 [Clostridium sp. ASBs410]
MNKRWEYFTLTNVWKLYFDPYGYGESVIAELSKDECGDWLLSSDLLGFNEEYFDDFNDHECLEVVQYRVEEMVHEHYIGDAKYYQEVANMFMEEK